MLEYETRSQVDELVKLTNDMVAHITRATFEECVDFVNQRAELVQQIESFKEELDTQSRQRLHSLVEYDSIFLSRMQNLRDEASDWLLKQGVIKEQRTAYNNGYTPDSMFFDQKN